MSLKAKVEAIIYAAEEPITLEQISQLLREVVLADLAAAKENAAIEQADSAAEARAGGPHPFAVGECGSANEETALLPELAPDSEDLTCPEAGPLMPQEAMREDAASSDAVQLVALPTLAVQSSAVQSSDVRFDNLDAHFPNELPDAQTRSSAIENDDAAQPELAASASVGAPEAASRKRQPKKSEQEIAEDKAVRARLREILVELVTDYSSEEHGIEIRQVAGGFRMATKPEHHDVVRAFAKSLKPPIRLSLAALETLAVIAYKQPITGPEISDIRGVESAGVLGTLLDRKLITTAGRKQVIGRPMQYKTSKDFLLRFGLNDVNELPSMEEFSQLASDGTIEITPPEAPSLFEPSTPEPSTPDQSAEAPMQVAESQQPDTDAADSQPQSGSESNDAESNDAESNHVPEAEHPIGK